MSLGHIMTIQKFSVHDGPGIRTTVFLKGCPLRCWWCHNPESQCMSNTIMFYMERCTHCERCVSGCTTNAIKIDEGYPQRDKTNCMLCGKCVDLCPSNALEYIGRAMTVEELMEDILKDEIFYDESGGGVTFSGGEPLLQHEFIKEMLMACKEKNIHTAIDTSGFGDWQHLKHIIDEVDLFLYDLKLMNDEKHIKYTGVSNQNILDNLRKLSEYGADIAVRMPIIAGINDDNGHIIDCIQFLSTLKILKVNLLPYHKMGMEKYSRLEMKYLLSGKERPSDERLREIINMFDQSGIKTEIGG
ncbi:trans-4-hydroxy-L-proline dehydratase activase [Vallitalea okinawensis]|uniref:trans-4-hydroxy-L-proline dehydratase activase n=1 Tax=Vallitalea okinawensis TaxID=2078660 RepID=UPI000CFC2DC0|nr:trans-4-hydroxy-L-proline dehydratase activase [Vallitalea okinawensis]